MGGRTLSDTENRDTVIIHATCVGVNGGGLLIVGRSGVGKSALALRMMSLGAALVADDRVMLTMVGDTAVADAPPAIRGLIEARGVGLLKAKPAGPVSIRFVADLDQEEQARLPEPVTTLVLRQTVPLLQVAGVPNLPAALMQLMKMGRVDPEWPST